MVSDVPSNRSKVPVEGLRLPSSTFAVACASMAETTETTGAKTGDFSIRRGRVAKQTMQTGGLAGNDRKKRAVHAVYAAINQRFLFCVAGAVCCQSCLNRINRQHNDVIFGNDVFGIFVGQMEWQWFQRQLRRKRLEFFICRLCFFCDRYRAVYAKIVD